jgi:hypothetical protein
MTDDYQQAEASGVASSTAPVFILTTPRSGSTLLRLLLDTHKDMASPAETAIPHLAATLASVWSAVLEEPLESSIRGFNAGAVSAPVIAQTRRVIDSMMEECLARHGKKIFCDKSLFTASYADLLVRLYPETRFICLVRHPMDFIRSAIDASPWGLVGFGFEEYAGSGNTVLALARYWVDQTEAIRTAARKFPAQCFLLRYEDLVDAPEMLASGLFSFLGVAMQPGISRQLFTAQHDRLGKADHKIWWTSEITSASVGRGDSIPPGLIASPILERMNAMLDALGYTRVDNNWGTPDGPADPRLPHTRPQVEARTQPTVSTGTAAAGGEPAFQDRLQRGLARIDDAFRQRWPSCSDDLFACISRSAGTTDDARCIVDLAQKVVADAGDGDYQWSVVGDPNAWGAVLSGEIDLGTAIRRSRLRYCLGSASDPAAQPDPSWPGRVLHADRMDMMAHLLGLAQMPAPVG